MLTAIRAFPFTSNLGNLPRELIDDCFGTINGLLLASRPQRRQARSRVATTTASATGHAALEGGRARTLVGLCDAAAAGAGETAITASAAATGGFGAASDVVGGSGAGIRDGSAPGGGAFSGGDADAGGI